MFLLGTLVPVVGLDGFARSVLQPLVGIIDLLGMYYAIIKTVGKPEIKILSVLVGWGLTESLLSTLLVYWSGARQYEFSWEFFEMAMAQNVELLQLASTVTLVWLWTRQDLSQSVVPLISGLLLLTLMKGLICNLVVEGGILSSTIGTNIGITFVVSTFALSLFLSITKVVNPKSVN